MIEKYTQHFFLALSLSVSLAACVSGGGDEVLEIGKLLIEHNATDEDTGFQGFADSEPWNELIIAGPAGDRILTANTAGSLFDFGLTEFFSETSEPEKTPRYQSKTCWHAWLKGNTPLSVILLTWAPVL